MERRVGEVFIYNGTLLQVKDTGHDASCNGCYFNGSICTNNEIKSIDQTGGCFRDNNPHLGGYYGQDRHHPLAAALL